MGNKLCILDGSGHKEITLPKEAKREFYRKKGEGFIAFKKEGGNDTRITVFDPNAKEIIMFRQGKGG